MPSGSDTLSCIATQLLRMSFNGSRRALGAGARTRRGHVPELSIMRRGTTSTARHPAVCDW